MPKTNPDLRENLAELPKVDLHRHLEGSLRMTTLLEFSNQGEVDMPSDMTRLRELVQVRSDEPRTHANFLAKFESLRRFFRTQDIVRRVSKEVVADAAADNVRYLELHFTPVALAQESDLKLSEVFDCVIEAASEEAAAQDMRLGLIASVNRHESVELAEMVTRLAIDRQDQGIVGLSLAGNEVGFSADPFQTVFAKAEKAGLGISVHAGEWSGAENVRHAIEVMSTTRIGHGVRVMEDPEIIALAREQRAVFEVCLTSNVHSGVVVNLGDHPLPGMIQAGLLVTLNTDNPGISNISLTDDYLLAVEELGLSLESLTGMILTAAQASFLPVGEKKALEAELLGELFPTDKLER